MPTLRSQTHGTEEEQREMSELLKTLMELTVDAVTWKQKAVDLERERDYLRERLAYLEKVVAERQ